MTARHGQHTRRRPHRVAGNTCSDRSCRALLLAAVLLAGCAAQIDPETLVSEAVKQHENGEYRAAMINLKNALQADGSNPEARYELGRLYVTMGNGVFAEKELRRAMQLGLSRPDMTSLLGRALLQQHKFVTVLTDVEADAVNTAPMKAEVLLMRGDAHLSLGNYGNAVTAYQSAGETDPDVNARVYTGLAKVALARNEDALAVEHIGKAMELVPDDPTVLLSKGLIDLKRKDMGSAEAVFLKIVELEGGQDVISSREFTAMVGLVQIYILTGRKEDADRYIGQLVAMAPEHLAPRYYRALLAYQRGDFDATVLQLQELLKLDPDNRPALMLMGAVKYAQGNLEQADMYLGVLINNDPDNIMARRLLATTRMQLEQPEYALNAIVGSGDDVITDTGFLVLAGAANLQVGKLDVAIDMLGQAAETEPDNLRIRGILARSYLEAGRADEAIEALGLAGRQGESSGLFNNDLLLVHALLKLDREEEALAYARSLVTVWPGRAELFNLLATIMINRGDNESGLQYLQNAVGANPSYVPALMNLGLVEGSRGNTRQAADWYRKVLAIDSGNSDAGYRLAMIERDSGNPDQALTLLEQIRDHDGLAVNARIALAEYYLSRRDFSGARKVVAEALAVAPDRSDVINMLGVTQMWLRDYDEAISSFRQVVAQEPGRSNPLYNLARAQLAANDFKSASANLKEVLKLKPDHAEAAMMFAVLEMKAGNTENALRLALQLLEKNSNNPAAHTLVGDIQMVRGDFSSAATAYRRAWELQSSGKSALKLLQALLRGGNSNYDARALEWLDAQPGDNATRLKLAEAYLTDRRYSSAIVQFEILLVAEPDNPVYLNNLAWLYHEQQDARALELARKAYDLAPRNAAIADTLGWLYTEAGQAARGVEVLEKALSLDPDNQSIRDHLQAARAGAGVETAN